MKRPRLLTWIVALVVGAVVIGGCGDDDSGPSGSRARPTIVIEHGAFTDASGWDSVVGRLQRRGYDVLAPANPLRGIAPDAAYLRSVLKTIKGPIVLVGHSYGGEHLRPLPGLAARAVDNPRRRESAEMSTGRWTNAIPRSSGTRRG